MGCPEDHVRLLGFHIFGVGKQEFLSVPIAVDVRAARQLNQAAYIAVVGCNNVGTGQAHEHQYLGGFLTGVFFCKFCHKGIEFLQHDSCFFLPVEFLAQPFNRGVHAFYAFEVQKQGADPDGGIFGLQVVLQGAGGQDVVGIKGFDDLQIRIHRHAHRGNAVVPLRQSAAGFADANQVKIQPVADLRYRGRGGYQADFAAFICAGCFLRVLVDAAGHRQSQNAG